MKGIKLFSILLLILCLVPAVFSEKVVITPEPPAPPYIIEYPPFNVGQIGNDLNFIFEVYNTSYIEQDNNTITCSLQIYKEDGSIIYNNNSIDYDSTNGVFSLTIPAAMITITGYYGYGITCQNGIGGGFSSSTFEVTRDGYSDELKYIPMLIAIIFFIGFLMYFAFSLEQDHFFLKLLMISFSLIGLYPLGSLFINGVSNTALTFLKLTTVIFWFTLIYFLVYMTNFWFNWIAKMQDKFSLAFRGKD